MDETLSIFCMKLIGEDPKNGIMAFDRKCVTVCICRQFFSFPPLKTFYSMSNNLTYQRVTL
uniref:Uncharacterized protein n=1 Tax=Arundo donax TaxID=35708 RepID=A0A0A9HP16_ARUDO